MLFPISYERSCRLAGISDSIFYKWKARGEKENEGVYLQFLQASLKASEQFKQTNINIIQAAAKDGTWQAAAWLLERKHPEEFGRRDRMNIDLNSQEDKLAEMLNRIRPE